MIHINSILKKYEDTISYRYLESIYLSCFYKAKAVIKQDNLNTDDHHLELLEKYFYDKLESDYIDQKDIEKIIEYFMYEMPRKLEAIEQKKLMKRNMEELDNNENILDEEDSIQTSTDISQDIGMNRRKNPKFVIQNIT